MTITAAAQEKFEDFITNLQKNAFPTKSRQWVIRYVVLEKGISATDF